MSDEQFDYLEQVVSRLEQEWFTIRLTEVQFLIAEVRSLRAKLDAVPVEALRFWRDPLGGELTAEKIDNAWDAITTWLDALEVPA